MLNQSTIDAISKAFAPIATKIGEGATFGWITVVKQQYISGVVSYVYAAICLIVLIALIIGLVKLIKCINKEEGDCGEASIMCSIFGIAIGVGLIVAFILNLTNGVQQTLNPDYYALQFFITLGKGPSN